MSYNLQRVFNSIHKLLVDARLKAPSMILLSAGSLLMFFDVVQMCLNCNSPFDSMYGRSLVLYLDWHYALLIVFCLHKLFHLDFLVHMAL